jgi:PleD family two-component response regulator
MSDLPTRPRPPLTLIANAQEWHSRSLESILGPAGFAVLRAYTARQTIERAISSRPDLIIVDTDLPDRDGCSVVRELRDLREISACTPILMSSTGTATRQRRIDALRAGAWDFIGSSLDAEEITLRLDALMGAKREVDRVREESLLDEITGLYNLRGLARRAREVSSQAFRHKEALAALVMIATSSPDSDVALSPEVLERLAAVLRATGRTSDVIGLLGPQELAIVANDTNAAGIERLAGRLAEAVTEMLSAEGLGLAIGFDSVENYADSPIDPTDLLTRASSAMRATRSAADGPKRRISLQRFDASTLN